MKQLSDSIETLRQRFAEDELNKARMEFLKGGDGDDGGDESPPPEPWK